MSDIQPITDRSEKEELKKLKKTFEEFIDTSSQLQVSYEHLKEESQRLSLYLSNILDNMNAAIMVFDNTFNLTLWNGVTHRYFPHLKNLHAPVAPHILNQQTVVDIESILKGNDKLVQMETRLDGVSRWLEVDASDFMNHHREKTGYLVVITDKTELKKLQLKSQQEDRLRVMGELAAEVAHEIRNPLGSIELMVTMLQEDLQHDEGHTEVLSRIRTSVDNMNHTVTNILLYTKEIHPDRTRFGVDQLVEQAEHIAANTIFKNKIQVQKNLDAVVINGDMELLKQSLANILINAAQAMEQKGIIQISTQQNGDRVKLLIKDSGTGIPEELRNKVFKPFFTTKNTGTGLGLAMVKRVIEAHSGKIYFESHPVGTTFFIELPFQ